MNNDTNNKKRTDEFKVLRAALKKANSSLRDAKAQIAELKAALDEKNTPVEPPYAAIAADESFIERYILTNEELKRQIIGEYLASLYGRKSAPVLRTALGYAPLTPPQKPKDLAEARRLAEMLMK